MNDHSSEAMVHPAACADSVGTGAPETEIEITPAMIDAGVNALWATGAIEHPLSIDNGVVRDVFIAMISASSSASKA